MIFIKNFHNRNSVKIKEGSAIEGKATSKTSDIRVCENSLTPSLEWREYSAYVVSADQLEAC